MATIHKIRNENGKVSYQVLIRKAELKPISKNFSIKKLADA